MSSQQVFSRRFFLPLGVSHPLPSRTATLTGPRQSIIVNYISDNQNLYNRHTPVCLYQMESNFIFQNTFFRQRKFTQSVLQRP